MNSPGSNQQVKVFALDLLHAETEQDVVAILTKAGYWNNPVVWRDYGDRESNFAIIGNQQSKPEAALVEKIVNSVDARLMNACLEAGIDPTSSAAPPDIRLAVDRFSSGTGGALRDWAAAARRAEAENITLAVTGARRHPNITIVDKGEGQIPSNVPSTFMSIDKSNKLRIPFVQGKFNMGGTGVLKFCGEHRFQLLITRRNPAILTATEKSKGEATRWSVTISRRQLPKGGAGQVRNSVFSYLAPQDASVSNKGEVLTFLAPSLPLMPEYNVPYKRVVEFGSAIKLFDYDMKGFSSHILMKDGLLYRLEALLPEIALPVNLHECRDFGGKTEKSFVTPLAGLTVRLEDGKGGNVEDGFPDSVQFQVRGERMTAKIYAFKEGRAATYTTNEGVIFSINGQTHGTLPKTLFGRKSVRLGRLAESLLVMVDCSEITVNAREDLFMNSRDRLSQHQLRKDIEAEIEEILAKHPKLKQLANDRREQEISERLADSKPLEEILGTIIKSSPTLTALFRTGQRLNSPFRRKPGEQHSSLNGHGDGSQSGERRGSATFAGKIHPTYFRFRHKKTGEILIRDCEYDRRCRISLETDVVNEYFERSSNPGCFNVEIVDTDNERHQGLSPQSSVILHNGLAHWSIVLPEDIEIGETLTVQLSITDPTLHEPFVNLARLSIVPQSAHHGGTGGRRKSNSLGGGGDQPDGITMPNIVEVKQDAWIEHKFDEKSACRIIQETDGTYTYYINIDNLFLLHEVKHGKDDASLLNAKFKFGNVLISMALIQDAQHNGKNLNGNGSEGNGHQTIEERVLGTTRAMGAFVIPMINSLGALTAADVASAAAAGDEE